MGFNEVKRAQQRRAQKRGPQLASTILRVVETVPDDLRVMVVLPENAAAGLGVKRGPWPLEERPNPKHSKSQPNRMDLLGLDGGVSSQPMRVEKGSTILADGIKFEDGRITASWYTLGSGPRADRDAGGLATIVEGHIRTSVRRNKETREVKYAAEVLNADRAVQVNGDDELQKAVTAAIGESGPGDGIAVVRVSGASGETVHRTFRPNYNESGRRTDNGELAGTKAVEIIGGKSELRELLKTGDNPETVTEVIPGRKLSIGATTQGHLETALAEKTGDRMNTGAKKFRTAEIHPMDRGVWPENQMVSESVSISQLRFLDTLAERRGIEVPEKAKSSSAAASAWIDEKILLLGLAPGQLVVREGIEGDEGEPYDIAVACALHRRSGLPIDAIPTPGCENAPEAARSSSEQAAAARAELMDGKVPAQAAAEEPEAPEEPARPEGPEAEPQEQLPDEDELDWYEDDESPF